ncbi:hypothetical protein BKA66DRAFT_564373 [Pyrenochaeta sp. MPI-SDFR-AT-0127]|nr:hypothetical protein BKA66DRAFT_564373 [Pyrenochaeta sp. MPI-SDFR-AT-0127]
MARSGSQKEGDGDYLLVVSGSTRNAPYLAGWQEFKDNLRKVVKEQPGWAEVFPSQSQRRGEKQGWCRLNDLEDADLAYNTYSGLEGMLVHIWYTRRDSEGFRFMKCNCSSVFSRLPAGSHSAGQCGIDIARVIQLSRNTLALSPQPYMTQPMYSYGIYPQAQTYNGASNYSAHTPQYPVYSTSTNGIPVNVQSGAFLTEARGIFIRNLSFNITPDDLSQLLSTVGYPVHYTLLRDTRTGTFKGTATAQFSSKEEAQTAVTYLDQRQHMGMTLSVRMDTEVTVVGRAEPPIVVNGSNPGSYGR